MPGQTLKKKKLKKKSMELEFQEVKFHANFFLCVIAPYQVQEAL